MLHYIYFNKYYIFVLINIYLLLIKTKNFFLSFIDFFIKIYLFNFFVNFEIF